MNREMKTSKKTYTTPNIEKIILDTEIALNLESTPPIGPDEAKNYMPEYFNNRPFLDNVNS